MMAETLTSSRVHDIVMANRVIRAPGYQQEHDEGVQYSEPDKGLQWGADAVPALLGLFLVEQDPRHDQPDGWVGFARHWRGGCMRLDFDLKPGAAAKDKILVVTGIFGRAGQGSITDEDFGQIELPEQVPTEREWQERVKGYQAARNKDDSDGTAAVNAYIQALPAWKRKVAQRFDDLIEREVPSVRRAVKWHIPFYGLEGEGWFASMGEFSKYMKLSFVCQEYMEPRPPSGTGPDRQAINFKEKDPWDEDQIASWIRQAAAMPALGGL